MKPLIGITTFDEDKGGVRGTYSIVSNAYANSVIKAGGIPVLIPINKNLEIIRDLIKRLDGLILTGGNEYIQPHLYNRNPTKDIIEINPSRDNIELKLLEEAVLKKIPIFGICRGMQLINVYFGGDLYLNIQLELEEVLGHCPSNTKKNYIYHEVEIEEGTLLEEIIENKKLGVNTYHSQAIRKVAPNLKVSATCKDGIIEAVEDVKNNIIGVQWHPEALTQEYDKHLLIFKEFIRRSTIK